MYLFIFVYILVILYHCLFARYPLVYFFFYYRCDTVQHAAEHYPSLFPEANYCLVKGYVACCSSNSTVMTAAVLFIYLSIVVVLCCVVIICMFILLIVIILHAFIHVHVKYNAIVSPT
ncbi:hypothetical protein, unlikely [Trypanosoma congolense IL3000]|uniref:Uncharacterized protein n=1 Tax=Trypanosoma congolense (strain IL3000) TaxID=1068625 RepID=F9W5B6_TRYCI|nr:hypothetical protein, unlikely [Trypanosoma congolense IL3000]